MIRVKLQILGLVLLAAVLCTADVMAQPGGDRGRGGFGGPGWGGGRLLDLLSNELIQKELEMSDDQIAEVQTLRDDSRRRRGEAMSKVRELFQGGDRQAAMEKARTVFGDLTKEDETDIEDFLIGEQFDRLKQLSIQRDLAGRNPNGALGKLLDMVEATDDEKDKFEEVKEKLEKEAAEKIAEIKAQTVEQIARESLSGPKADKFMEFIGESMEGGAEAFRDRGWQGRGGRGGRGGDRGGRGGGGRDSRPEGDV